MSAEADYAEQYSRLQEESLRSFFVFFVRFVGENDGEWRVANGEDPCYEANLPAPPLRGTCLPRLCGEL